jgi:hypothetical protein
MPLAVIGVGVVAATGFIIHVLWPRWPEPPIGLNAPALPITVAGVPFTVPPAAIRIAFQRQPGAHDRVDLAFLWPSLQPPEPVAAMNVPTKGVPRQLPFERIFVTISIARESLPPEERVKTIYSRYVEVEPVAGPEGLSVLPFRRGTPYQGEDLIYDAVNPRNFLVRCSRGGAGPTPGICLQVKRIDASEIVLRFPRQWLEDWRDVAERIEKLITSLRPAGS